MSKRQPDGKFLESTHDAPPTERQRKIYEFILKTCQKNGTGPSVRDIGRRFKIGSPNGVAGHLAALKKKGLIVTGEWGEFRGIRPTCSYTVEAVG